MNTQEARDIVLTALAEIAPETDPMTLDPEADFAEALDLDSMDHLNMILAINAKTGIEIPERDYPRLGTLNDAVAYLTAG